MMEPRNTEKNGTSRAEAKTHRPQGQYVESKVRTQVGFHGQVPHNQESGES
jgi:hypothetical protein